MTNIAFTKSITPIQQHLLLPWWKYPLPSLVTNYAVSFDMKYQTKYLIESQQFLLQVDLLCHHLSSKYEFLAPNWKKILDYPTMSLVSWSNMFRYLKYVSALAGLKDI